MRRRLLIPLPVAAIFALVPATASAEWLGADPTVVTTECTPSLVGVQTYSEDCRRRSSGKARSRSTLTREHLASFRFAGGARYEAALDRGRFRRTGASFSRQVSTGPHVLRLREEKAARATVFHWRVLPRRG